jgi:hypothetical protein
VATRRLEAGQRVEIEQRLTDLGFTWEYRSGEPLDAFDWEKSLKNQARLGNPLRPATVDRYKVALANHAKFPAIIAATQPRSGHLVVDGNHRGAAHTANGRKGIDTYLIIDGDPQAVTMLTFEANTTHGDATTEEERTHQALWMIDNGMSAEDAARRLGVKASTVRNANTLHQAKFRADEAGIDPREWDHLSTVLRARLFSVATDEGFAELTKLTIGAGLSAAEVNEHVKSLTDLRSSKKQVEYVKALRDVYADRLQRGGRATGKGVRGWTPRQTLAMALGQLSALPEPATVIHLMNDGERAETRKKVTAARERLEALEAALV